MRSINPSGVRVISSAFAPPLVVGFADRLASGDLGRRFQPSIVHASTANPGTRWNSRALLAITAPSSAKSRHRFNRRYHKFAVFTRHPKTHFVAGLDCL